MRTATALLLAALVTGITLSSPPGGASAAPVELLAVADTYVSSAEPDASFGSAGELLAGSDPAKGDATYRAYVQFDVPNLGRKVANVRLQLHLTGSGSRDVVVGRAEGSVSETGTTWATAPDEGAVVMGERSLIGDGWVEIKLAADALDPRSQALVISSESGDLISFQSRESGSGPRLVVQLTAAAADGTSAPDPTPSPTEAPEATAPPEPTASPDPTMAPTPVPTATASPTSQPTSEPAPTVRPGGIPPIPDGYGRLLRKDFSDGQLAPFRVLTYPNDHPGDLMIQYGRFVTSRANVSVHDGYLDLRATRNADGTWNQAFVGTGLTGDGSPAAFQFQYGTARAMARMNSGRGAWQSLWYLVADRWGAPEIDWAELIGGRLTANIHGSSADGQKVSLPAFPSNEWHEYGITKAPGYIAFLLDGREVARVNVSMSASMGLLADAKVGLTAPDSSTPSTLFLHVAWWTVDPLP